jgi:hypothetical protein
MPRIGLTSWLRRVRTPIGLGAIALALASVVLLVNLVLLFASLIEQ